MGPTYIVPFSPIRTGGPTYFYLLFKALISGLDISSIRKVHKNNFTIINLGPQTLRVLGLKVEVSLQNFRPFLLQVQKKEAFFTLYTSYLDFRTFSLQVHKKEAFYTLAT